jgi:hypothetical protein
MRNRIKRLRSNEERLNHPDRKLYAAAIEYYARGQWHADIRYIHGCSYNEAKFLFKAAHTQEFMHGTMKLVDIAPCVGYFAEERKGVDRLVNIYAG